MGVGKLLDELPHLSYLGRGRVELILDVGSALIGPVRELRGENRRFATPWYHFSSWSHGSLAHDERAARDTKLHLHGRALRPRSSTVGKRAESSSPRKIKCDCLFSGILVYSF